VEVVEVMSAIIEHLVKGEVMQMKVLRLSQEEGASNSAVMEYYL
jgi:geranylgeranyl pyrophosphate synthase